MKVNKVVPLGEICPLLSSAAELMECVGPACRWYIYGPNRCMIEYIPEIAAAISENVDRDQGYSISPLLQNPI